MRIGQMCDLKGSRALIRDPTLEGTYTKAPKDEEGLALFFDYGLIVDSAIQEIYLCIIERRLASRAKLSDNL